MIFQLASPFQRVDLNTFGNTWQDGSAGQNEGIAVEIKTVPPVESVSFREF